MSVTTRRSCICGSNSNLLDNVTSLHGQLSTSITLGSIVAWRSRRACGTWAARPPRRRGMLRLLEQVIDICVQSLNFFYVLLVPCCLHSLKTNKMVAEFFQILEKYGLVHSDAIRNKLF